MANAVGPDQAAESQDLYVVLADGRPDVIAIAKSILLDAGIDFCVTGEVIQDLFGYGRVPAGHNALTGPIEILVRPADARAAEALLVELRSTDSSAAKDGPQAPSESDSPAPRDRDISPEAMAAAIFVGILMLGGGFWLISDFLGL